VYLAAEPRASDVVQAAQIHGIVATSQTYTLEWLIFSVSLVMVVVWVAMVSVRSTLERDVRDEAGDTPTGIRVETSSLILTGAGLIGSIGHAVFVTVAKQESWAPVLDITTISWLGVALVGMLLPRIAELTFSGVSIRLGEVAKAKAETEDIILSATDLSQKWTSATSALLAQLEDPETKPSDAHELVTQFLQLRAYEALEWLGADHELRRLSIWLFDADSRQLSFFFSNEITDPETRSFAFPIGVGVAGSAYRDHRIWSERDATALPVYVAIRATPPRYRGLLCVPIDFGETRLGVLCVDRQAIAYFEKRDENVIRALASIFGAALGNQSSQRLLG